MKGKKKVLSKGLIVAIIIIAVVAVIGGYIALKRPTVFKSEREVSEAITNISGGVEQIGSIIEDIDKSLGK